MPDEQLYDWTGLSDDEVQARLVQRGLTYTQAWRLIEYREDDRGAAKITQILERPPVRTRQVGSIS